MALPQIDAFNFDIKFVNLSEKFFLSKLKNPRELSSQTFNSLSIYVCYLTILQKYFVFEGP